MINNRLKLHLMSFQEKINKLSVLPDYVLFFLILSVCNLKNCLEQIYLISDYLELKEFAKNEKAILNNLKVMFY